MRYEKRKEFAAILSLLSVAIAVLAATRLFADLNKDSFVYSTVAATIIAAFAASITIIFSRRLQFARRRKQLFFVYAREDVEAARKLALALKEAGFNPWLDVDQITPGQLWQKAVLRALEESAVALVLVSKNLSKKGFVQKELEVALKTLQEQDQEICPVIPVRLDDSSVPEQIQQVQWVNLFEKDGIAKLIAGLKKVTE